MPNKMLIDSTHPEETRVVVVRGNRVEEFDFESASRKQLRGNIYLAKVTRVEPSLQAAFVDYGGNRHGFLAFSEIHPDYYQIPIADRQALLAAEEEEAHEEERAANAEAEARHAAEVAAVTRPATEWEAAPPVADETAAGETATDNSEGEGTPALEPAEALSHGEAEDAEEDTAGDDNGEDHVESVGAEDALEEVPERKRVRPRQYKIQEVIKRRQVLLVQVVKEERGNKGAALTTYLSLAGRYSVLMPNTARGGGISRKITSLTDRKRLKQVAADLDVPEGMGIILRTAGASRTKAEVKRDFEYLLRLWENVRELTLRSTAPALVYEEGSLVKRSIRDLYNKDIDEVLVAGDDAYREAKDFMRMLMPSHAKNVQPYKEAQPIFARSGVESQLDAMFSPQVTLRSGGYIVINQTEALVSIDVNSGRSTREHNIEDTAHQTNLEAADEVARQLRLRDLAGLIVIDFIDMEEKRNNRSVERRLKEALKNDRARIQVGRISHFGLLEMSRQRIRTGVVESTSDICPHCQGTGHVRAPSSVALHVLRSIEDNLLKAATHNLVVRTKTAVALYILNQKRSTLSELEQRFGLSISILADESVIGPGHFTMERGELVTARPERTDKVLQPDSVQPPEETEPEEEVEEEEEELEDDADDVAREPGEDRSERGGRRRRRRRRRGGERPAEGARPSSTDERIVEGDEEAEPEPSEEQRDVEDRPRGPRPEGGRRRRRGRRGGRRNGERVGEPVAPATETNVPLSSDLIAAVADLEDEWPEIAGVAAEEPKLIAEAEDDNRPGAVSVVSVEAPEDRPGSRSTEGGDEPRESAVLTPTSPANEPGTEEEDESRPKRAGWWQRRGFF